MTKEYCLGEEYDHADIVVVAGKGHSDAGKSERDEDCISYCKVNKGSLMLYSTTFRDMFDVAGTGGIDGERIEGLPFITLHEEPEPLCQFLSFFNEDADRWSQCNTLEYRDLILIWTMSLKYDTKHVRYFCEREMRSSCWTTDPEPGRAEAHFLAYVTAILWRREGLAPELLARTFEFNIAGIDEKTLAPLSSSQLSTLYKAHIASVKDEAKRESHRTKRVKLELDSIEEQWDRGLLESKRPEGRKAFKAAIRKARLC